MEVVSSDVSPHPKAIGADIELELLENLMMSTTDSKYEEEEPSRFRLCTVGAVC